MYNLNRKNGKEHRQVEDLHYNHNTRLKHLPAEKAGKDQKYLCGFSRFECGNTDSRVCYGLHLETISPLTRAYILRKLKSIDYLILTIAKGKSRQHNEAGSIPSIPKRFLRQFTAYENSNESSLIWLSTMLKKPGQCSKIPSSNAGGSKSPSLEHQMEHHISISINTVDYMCIIQLRQNASYKDLIPCHMVVRSSCTLGLLLLVVDETTSVSKKPMYLLSKGCKPSNSDASLHTKIKNYNQLIHEAYFL